LHKLIYNWHLQNSKNKTGKAERVESGVDENNQQTQYTERKNEGIAQDMRKKKLQEKIYCGSECMIKHN